MVPNGVQDTDAVQSAVIPSSKSKKNKRRKNKNVNSKINGDLTSHHENGHNPGQENIGVEQDNCGSEDELDSPQTEENHDYPSRSSGIAEQLRNGINGSSDKTSNGISLVMLTDSSISAEQGSDHTTNKDTTTDTEERLEAAAKERDRLREEVIELRKSLEIIQQRHDTSQERHEEELATLSARLEATGLEHKENVDRVNAHLQETRKRHEEDIAGSNAQLEEIRRQHSEEITVANQKNEENENRHMEKASKFSKSLEEMRQRYEDDIAALRTRLEDNEKQYEEAIALVNTQSERIRRQHEEGINSANSSLEESRKHHEEQLAVLSAELEETRRQKVEEIVGLNLRFAETEKRNEEELSGVMIKLVETQTRYNEGAGEHNARLEEMQQRHEDELATLNTRLEESFTAKEHAETQYQKLLGKVNTIKTQLGERLKADAADLLQARGHIEELEEQNRAVTENNQTLQSQITDLTSEKEQQSEELSSLRARANLSQQNWVKERDDLLIRLAQIREEYESAKQAMQDWEVLAMEERSIREGLGDRVIELEEQLSNHREAYERATSERDTQSLTVDGLQRALHDIQEARKLELREMVENSQTQLEELRRQLKIAEELGTSSQNALESTRQELEKALPFEREVKEKNLLIGKLRHEAVILNDHLTKALRFLKRAKPEDVVDRQLVTNHFLQFLALDRSDPKKFQILQLISAILSWNDEQNETAGLARPGASAQPINTNNSLRAPLSPFLRRVSSSASLNAPMNLNNIFTTNAALSPTVEAGVESPGKESLAELWSGFLERESAARANTGSVDGSNAHSRQPSFGNGRRDTMMSPTSGTSTPRYGGYSVRGSRSPSMSGA